MEGTAKKELLQLAKRLRAKAAEFERAKDFGKAEQARVYAAYLEETAKKRRLSLKSGEFAQKYADLRFA
jgi:hypothetical protein